MPLVPAKCTSCGAPLTLDPTQDAAICPFCNTPFIVEKAIHNYTTVNHYNTTQNITAETVIVQNSRQEELCQAAETFYSLANHEEAGRKFAELADAYPADWRGWWGLYRVFLHHVPPQFLTDSILYRDPISAMKNALQLASDDTKKELLETIRSNVEALQHMISEKQALIAKKEADKDSIHKQYMAMLESSTSALEYNRRKSHLAKCQNEYEQKLQAQQQPKDLRRALLSVWSGDPRSGAVAQAKKQLEAAQQSLWAYEYEYNESRGRLQLAEDLEINKVDTVLNRTKMDIQLFAYRLQVHEEVLNGK